MSCHAILCNELPAYMPSVLPCLAGMKYCGGKGEGNGERYGVDGRLVVEVSGLSVKEFQAI